MKKTNKNVRHGNRDGETAPYVPPRLHGYESPMLRERLIQQLWPGSQQKPQSCKNITGGARR